MNKEWLELAKCFMYSPIISTESSSITFLFHFLYQSLRILPFLFEEWRSG
jgi:hypothetical protein